MTIAKMNFKLSPYPKHKQITTAWDSLRNCCADYSIGLERSRNR